MHVTLDQPLSHLMFCGETEHAPLPDSPEHPDHEGASALLYGRVAFEYKDVRSVVPD